jgi:hypothetical protein
LRRLQMAAPSDYRIEAPLDSATALA